MQEKPKILAVVGPTASGKTGLATQLALRLSGEVICCDSMQIYRNMSIGTAKPTEEEKCGIPHHLFDIKDPDEPFSAQEYVTLAEKAVIDILRRGKLPIFCGGTGLYLDAFLRGGMPETPGADPTLRAELAAYAEAHGAEALHAALAAVDPDSAESAHPNNLRRVIRALEIWHLTGVPKSEWDRRSKELPARYNAAVLGLVFDNRALLYERIERRVDLMLADGLLEETRALLDAGVFARSPTAAAAIGYKELLPHLRGASTLADAVTELKTATRRYAKRQLTWFSAKEYVCPLVMDGENGMLKSEQIVNNACALAEGAWDML